MVKNHEAVNRIDVSILSVEQNAPNIITTRYKAGYGEITVKSCFIGGGGESLEDLFFGIVQNKLASLEDECYNEKAIGLRGCSVISGGNL